MSNYNWLNEVGIDRPVRISLDWDPLEALQQAPVYQPDPVRDSVDRTQGREHAMSDPRYPDVKPRLRPCPNAKHTDGRPLWECSSGGFDTTAAKHTAGWFRYGNGWTPEEAYAEWKEDRAP